MKNIHTLQEAKNILAKDIILRDQESFTYQSDKDRLHWEKSLPAGESSSSFLTSASTVEDALKEAYRLASNMLTAMCLPEPVEIEVSHQDDGSWTNSKLVHVTTNCFDNPHLTVGQKLDIFIGLTVHEGCHVLYTDFYATKGMSSFGQQLDNILEDEYIEHRCGDEMPGLGNFLKMAKWYYFGEYHQKYASDQQPSQAQQEAVRLVNAVIKLVRFRGALNDEEITDFADALVEVHDALIPFPVTSLAVAKKAEEIEQILLKYMTMPPKQQEEQGSNGQGDDSQQGSDSQQGDQSQQKASSSGNGSSGSKPSDQQQDDASSGNNASGQQPQQGNGKTSGGAGLTEQEARQILAEMSERLKDLSKNPGEGLDDEDECEAVREDDTLNKRLTGKTEEAHGVDDTYFIKTNATNQGAQYYQAALNEIRRFIPAMRNALRNHADEVQRTLTGCRSGHMDTNLLASAFQGVPNVYRQTQTIKADPITVCLVIDESGSMYGDKAYSAMKTAVLLEQALIGITGVDLYVYGYTDDDHNDIRIFREKGFAPRYAIGEIGAFNGTPTGAAIKACANRIRHQTQNKCLMFVITDGYSADNTREAVDKVSRDGFIPVGIGIEAIEQFKEDFSECIYLTDMSKLPQSLGQIVKKAIMQNSRRHVS